MLAAWLRGSSKKKKINIASLSMCNTSNERIPEFSFIDGAQSLPRAWVIINCRTVPSCLYAPQLWVSIWQELSIESTASFRAERLKITFVTSDICLSNHLSDLNLWNKKGGRRCVLEKDRKRTRGGHPCHVNSALVAELCKLIFYSLWRWRCL